MPTLTPIERETLGSIANDYESPSTIVAEVSQALGRAVSESELAATLAKLAAYGLAQAYVYDSSLGNYRSVPVADLAGSTDLWFLITAAGRAADDNTAG